MSTWFFQRPLRLVGALVVVAAVVGGGYFYFNKSSSAPGTIAPRGAPVPVQVVLARTGPIRTVLTYSGAIQSVQQVNVAPRIAGQLASITVDVGAAVKVGDTLARLDPGTLPAQLLQAQASLQSTQARLDLMLAGPRAADVVAAEAALAAAEARLRVILNPSPGDLSAAEAALVSAQIALDNGRLTVITARNSLVSAVNLYCATYNAVVVKCETPIPVPQDDLDQLQVMLRSSISFAVTDAGPKAIALTSANAAYVTARNNIVNLQQALSAAMDKYGQLRSPSPSDVAAQRSVVETARAVLDNRRLPYTDADIAGARALVAAAQAGVAAARTALDQTSLIAPFGGIVAQKLLDVGATVSPQTPVFVLIAKAVESHLTVDEARVGLIRPDMEAEVSVPAYPNRVFKGAVATIAPLGDARAHTFDVKVIAEDREGLLKPGMFAQVNVIAATKPNAILVPTAAIIQQGPTARVFVIVNGKAAAKTVKVGIADTTSSEITEGLAAGDAVVTVGQNVLRDEQAVQVATPAPGGGGAGGAGGTGGGARPTGATGASPAQGGTPAASGTPPARPAGTGTP